MTLKVTIYHLNHWIFGFEIFGCNHPDNFLYFIFYEYGSICREQPCDCWNFIDRNLNWYNLVKCLFLRNRNNVEIQLSQHNSVTWLHLIATTTQFFLLNTLPATKNQIKCSNRVHIAKIHRCIIDCCQSMKRHSSEIAATQEWWYWVSGQCYTCQTTNTFVISAFELINANTTLNERDLIVGLKPNKSLGDEKENHVNVW